jgi:RNA polymerase sigma-70 factor (ECF subfamily)
VPEKLGFFWKKSLLKRLKGRRTNIQTNAFLRPVMLNPSTFSQILDENLHGLVLYARQWTDAANSWICAEDVVQEAFVRLLQENPMPHSPKAWLYRVVRNLAIDQMRKAGRTTSLTEQDDWFETGTDSLDITESLRKLDDEIREIVVSKIWGNLTFREIAELTGRPISSIHYDYQQGLAQLKELLQ